MSPYPAQKIYNTVLLSLQFRRQLLKELLEEIFETELTVFILLFQIPYNFVTMKEIPGRFLREFETKELKNQFMLGLTRKCVLS